MRTESARPSQDALAKAYRRACSDETGQTSLKPSRLEGADSTSRSGLVVRGSSAYVLMPEYAAKSVRSFFCTSVKLGLMERGLNEAFNSSRAPGNQSEPVYLYRLAPCRGRQAGRSGVGVTSSEAKRLRGYEAMSLRG